MAPVNLEFCKLEFHVPCNMKHVITMLGRETAAPGGGGGTNGEQVNKSTNL